MGKQNLSSLLIEIKNTNNKNYKFFIFLFLLERLKKDHKRVKKSIPTGTLSISATTLAKCFPCEMFPAECFEPFLIPRQSLKC